MASILIVDDEETLARALARFLDRRRYGATVAINGAQARAALSKSRPDLVLLDQRLGDEDGIELLRESHATDPDLPFIVMTAYGSVETAVAAMKAGARDYIQKPIDLEQLALVVDRALTEARTQACLDRIQHAPLDQANATTVLGTSPAMQLVHDFLDRMTRLDGLPAGEFPTVLLLGETGTGKSLVARALHQSSALARRPFLVFDCTVVPRELGAHERDRLRRTGEEARRGQLELADGHAVRRSNPRAGAKRTRRP